MSVPVSAKASVDDAALMHAARQEFSRGSQAGFAALEARYNLTGRELLARLAAQLRPPAIKKPARVYPFRSITLLATPHVNGLTKPSGGGGE